MGFNSAFKGLTEQLIN